MVGLGASKTIWPSDISTRRLDVLGILFLGMCYTSPRRPYNVRLEAKGDKVAFGPN